MSKRLVPLMLGILLTGWLVFPVLAATDLGIITGGEKGTYYQFGLNLQRLGKQDGVNLTVHPSKGSIENVYAVYQRPATQLGIVQSDVLAFVARVQSDPVLRRIAKKTKMVFPLYNEEIHILGRPGIAEFDDLSDRRVAIGREGSGTYLTARLLFNVSEVHPGRWSYRHRRGAGGAEGGPHRRDVLCGRVPGKALQRGSHRGRRVWRSLPSLNKSITEFYPRSGDPGEHIPWQSKAVDTVAVKAVLISFDFRRRDCDTVGRFAKTISDNMDWLVKNGHSKWKAVDLGFPLKGWEQYDCVRKYLGKTVEANGLPEHHHRTRIR